MKESNGEAKADKICPAVLIGTVIGVEEVGAY